MKWTYIISRILLSTLAIFALATCSGKKNKADGAKIKIIPDTPIVITADVTVSGKDLKAPWFDFKVEIENNTEFPFEIVALQAEITGTDTNGQLSTKTVAWSPGEYNYSTLTDLCEYGTFGTWQPGDSKRLAIAGSGTCVSGNVIFPADANPKGNYRYKVKLKPLGYFIDEVGDPSDRFDKSRLFFTK